MLRHALFIMAAFLLSLSVSRASLSIIADESLLPASDKLKKKEYSAARQAALDARPGAARDLMLGLAAYRLELWDEAQHTLAGNADRLPLLGDFPLYYRASALSRLNRFDEALPLLERLRQDYPESPLYSQSLLLSADILYRKGDFQNAMTSYLHFAESYPSGADALKALHRSALCREKLGDAEGAASDLRRLWLANPGNGVAAEAEADLERLRKAGVVVPPYTGEELMQRGLILLDRGSSKDAAAALASIPPESVPSRLRGRLAFKTALALYRAKRNQEAEAALARLASPDTPYPEYAVEALYWQACALDRIGRGKEAEAAFLKLIADHPAHELADDALLQAALIRKREGDRAGSAAVFKRIPAEYPSSSHVPRALWETAWSLYLTGGFREAADTFGRLASEPAYRERALYWKGRSLEAAGSPESAREARAALLEEFPIGYYALRLEKETGARNGRVAYPPPSLVAPPPLPDGYDRAKTLISLGMYEEARMELAAVRRRSGAGSLNRLELAGLYLAVDDYNSAMGLVRSEALTRADNNSHHVWGILYPAGFGEVVRRCSADTGIDESLTFALIRAESSFSPTARSPVGAVGLMQLMPSTARDTARDMKEPVTETTLTRPDLNVRLGTRHLRDLLARFNGDVVSAVAAYNAGVTPVNRWRKSLANLREDEFIENIPYPETREYVKKVLAGMEIYRRLYPPAHPSQPFSGSQKAYSSACAPSAETVSLSLSQ